MKLFYTQSLTIGSIGTTYRAFTLDHKIPQSNYPILSNGESWEFLWKDCIKYSEKIQ